MSSSNDTTRLETGDLLIEKNADGDLVIRNLAGGPDDVIELGGGGASIPSVDTDELSLTAQDLSTVSGVDGRIYHHDGSNSITADGGTTSATGHYVWSATDSEWKSIVQY